MGYFDTSCNTITVIFCHAILYDTIYPIYYRILYDTILYSAPCDTSFKARRIEISLLTYLLTMHKRRLCHHVVSVCV